MQVKEEVKLLTHAITDKNKLAGKDSPSKPPRQTPGTEVDQCM
jgi:hypothetical protein